MTRSAGNRAFQRKLVALAICQFPIEHSVALEQRAGCLLLQFKAGEGIGFCVGACGRCWQQRPGARPAHAPGAPGTRVAAELVVGPLTNEQGFKAIAGHQPLPCSLPE